MEPIPPALADGRYQFSNDWFGVNVESWDRILTELRPSRVLEVGSYEGRSACFLIERISATTAIELHCVDTWQGSIENDRFDENISVAASLSLHRPSITKHRRPSYLALAHLVATGHFERFDLIYVDGSHQAPDVLSDAVLCFHLLRVGGVLIFDDYLWHLEPVGHQDPLNMPKPAIDAFLNLFQRKMRILPGFPLAQIYALKTSN
jgi:predicted O-methyltransferase YrrM